MVLEIRTVNGFPSLLFHCNNSNIIMFLVRPSWKYRSHRVSSHQVMIEWCPRVWIRLQSFTISDPVVSLLHYSECVSKKHSMWLYTVYSQSFSLTVRNLPKVIIKYIIRVGLWDYIVLYYIRWGFHHLFLMKFITVGDYFTQRSYKYYIRLQYVSRWTETSNSQLGQIDTDLGRLHWSLQVREDHGIYNLSTSLIIHHIFHLS